jgi:cytochrome P450
MPHCASEPFFLDKFIFPFERDLLANCKALRQIFDHMIINRRELIKNDPEAAKKKEDLLSILLTNELFSLDNEMIVDECLTFFFAGSQTNSVVIQNLIMHLLKNRHYGDKIVEEIEQEVVQPYLKPGHDGTWEPTKFLDMIEYE